MNWKELKEFCNLLTEEQLNKNVILWQEDYCISKIETLVLDEDYYKGDNTSEGCFPLSEAKDIADDPDEFPNGVEDLIKVYDKGHPILREDF